MYIYILWEYVGTYGNIREISWNIWEISWNIWDISWNIVGIQSMLTDEKTMEWMGKQWQPLNEQIGIFSGILPWVNAITMGINFGDELWCPKPQLYGF